MSLFTTLSCPGTSMKKYQYPLACLLLSVWSCAMAIDEPSYTVVRSAEAFEVRRYEPYLVAETIVSTTAGEAGNQGFRILAGYIFGGNKGARKIEMTAPAAQSPAKIAMTTPVAQSASAAGYAIQFAMPREWTLQSLPEPNDARVMLWEVPSTNRRRHPLLRDVLTGPL